MDLKDSYWRRIDHIVGPARAHEFQAIGQQRTRTAFEDWIITESGPGTRLLDAGCNTGVEGWRLYARGFTGIYVGVDSNPKALGFALENLAGRPASFLLADLDSVPFDDGAFDIVLNKDVIEHAERFEPILGEMARLARRALVLSLFIRPHDGPDVIHKTPDGYYLNRYNRDRLCAFLEQRGFSRPAVLYIEDEDEVLLFNRRSAPPARN